MATVAAEIYERICPTCGTHNAPQTMRCGCGALLAGVDLTQVQAKLPDAQTAPVPQAPAAPDASDAPDASAPPGSANPSQSSSTESSSAEPSSAEFSKIVCGFDDCGQTNPAGTATCLYCNRPLGSEVGLISLPGALQSRYRVVQLFAARGAEAELMVVEPIGGGPQLVAKVYRKGILPKPQVRERASKVDRRYRVEVVEEGVAGGLAFEVMEYCRLGSLRELQLAGPIPQDLLQIIIAQLSEALNALHAQGLVHRDFKPENVLLRSREPLQLVLTDFGIASALDATQRFTGDARTLLYASPESLSGVIDAKYDYWSLGMVALELALGRHPFQGLSDPVILHQLITRSVDLSGLHDVRLRKLLRGLLLRDPKQRWGHAEVLRWLQNDPLLPDADESEAAVVFNHPYKVAGQVCNTPHELATALAQHWDIGIADVRNGQLLHWFRDVQRDQDVVRILAAAQSVPPATFESLRPLGQLVPTMPDLVLARLIIHLAPGLPPVWRGASLDLRNVLSRANLALKGDGPAAHWLASVFSSGVLAAYAEAGDEEIDSLQQRWQAAVQQFQTAWKMKIEAMHQQEVLRNPQRVVNFDALVFGQQAMSAPPIESLHARLLALSYDAGWADRLRTRLQSELITLRLHCAWLDQLGDPKEMEGPDLLVLESLLPEARRVAATHQETQRQQQAQLEDQFRELLADHARLVMLIRDGATSMLGNRSCARLSEHLQQFSELLATLRSRGEHHARWLELRRKALRLEPVLNRIEDLVAKLMQRRAITRGFLNARVAGFFAAAFFVLPLLPGLWPGYLLALSAIALVLWRVVPEILDIRAIRELGRKLPE